MRFALAGFVIIVTLIFHWGFIKEISVHFFRKDLAIAGGLLLGHPILIRLLNCSEVRAKSLVPDSDCIGAVCGCMRIRATSPNFRKLPFAVISPSASVVSLFA